MEGSLFHMLNRDLPCGAPGGDGNNCPRTSVLGQMDGALLRMQLEGGWMDGWMDGWRVPPLLRLSPQPLEERSGIGPRLGGRAGSSGRASASFSCSWP
jgi:hypothetical protein